jgi:hypothetical protein
MIDLFISIFITYIIYQTFFRVFFPKKYFRLKVLLMYEFDSNSLKTIMDINQYSNTTNIYATESTSKLPDNTYKYKPYNVQENVASGSCFQSDTRTGELVFRCALWERL